MNEIDKCKNGFYCIEPCHELQQLKAENIKLHRENMHYVYLISAYRVCFEGALGAMQSLLKNNCDNAKYWASVAKGYLSFRYEEQQEAKNIYDKHFSELKAENEQLKTYLKTVCKYYAPANECALTGNNCYGTSKCIEKLQAENEELKNCDKTNIYKQARVNFEKQKKYKQCLDEIEEMCKHECEYECSNNMLNCGICSCLEQRIQRKIKEVKE